MIPEFMTPPPCHSPEICLYVFLLFKSDSWQHCITFIAGIQQPACPPIQLVSGLQLLATHCSLWAATFDRDAPLVRDLLSQLTEHVRTIGVHVSHLLQVCEVSVKKSPFRVPGPPAAGV